MDIKEIFSFTILLNKYFPLNFKKTMEFLVIYQTSFAITTRFVGSTACTNVVPTASSSTFRAIRRT
ncbi:hypothetical protein CW304_20980 [Bacillus sp. UFRGS-B20]|nr:hypothetical protein CW304_20980 [Bacillus sp. UFRGS-B20]